MKQIIYSFFVLCLAVAASADEKRYNIPLEGAPAHGAPQASVTIIEFIDYQ